MAFFGEVPGIPLGALFEDRRALAVAHVHRPLQAGICGLAEEGAESIVLSGGYVDDEDCGDVIYYTGAGGRDVETKRQVRPQQLNHSNLALANNLRHGLPVRVSRRVEEGYRYDGLYQVEDYWPEVGRDGFRIWRFKLVKMPTQEGVAEPIVTYDVVAGRRAVVTRVVRDTAITRQIKSLYGYHCQVCDVLINTPAGPYAEGAHIRPLGRPHNGPDALANALCLCPNHHVRFDRWQFALADDLTLIGVEGNLQVDPRHRIGGEHVRYHRALYEAANAA